MAACVTLLFECNLRAFILRGILKNRLVSWLGAAGYNMRSRRICIRSNLNRKRYIRDVLEPELLPLLEATPYSNISAGQCPVTCGEYCTSLLWRTTGVSASLTCSISRNVTHRTYLGYGWPTTCSSWSSSYHPWGLADSHTHCVEGHSPRTYPGTL
jgi:hypothetical protein